jgi:uridine kinase
MQRGRPLRVGIDGRCGSGKTTLADEMADVLRSRGVKVLRRPSDDYHHPGDHRYRQGEFSARGYYEDAFDHTAILRAVHEAALPNTILLFEGVFLFRSELNACWDCRILVDVDAATSIERSVARDTGILGPRDLILRKCIERYDPAWLIYVARDDPEAKADIVIDNRDPAYPDIRRE